MREWRRLRIVLALVGCTLIPATGASAASMEWSQLGITATRASRLLAISCTSSTACTSVGFSRTSFTDLSLIESWNGEKWSVQANETGGSLSGVSCSSATTCVAVGKIEGIPMAQHWGGSKWTTVFLPSPEPEGFEGASMQGVSCASSTFCIAVGSYKVSGKTYVLADSWNGKEWKESLTQPFSPGMALSAVSCSSSTACTTVATPGAGSELVAWRWNGEKWSSQVAFAPGGTETATLAGVSCPSSTVCMAVGSYTSEKVAKTLAERWNGEKWEVKTTPNPAESSGSSFTAVSCPSAEVCEATGTYTHAGSGRPLVEDWASGEWTLDTLPEGGTTLSGVSCTSTSWCMATGYKGSEGYELLAEKGTR